MWPVGPSKNPLFAQSVHNMRSLPRGRRAGLAIGHQVDSQKKPKPAHITNERMLRLQFPQLANPLRANRQRVLLQIFIAQNIQHRKPRRTCNGVSSKSAEKFHSVRKGSSNFLRGHHRRQGEGIPHRLSEHDYVRHYTLRSKSPKVRAQAAETHLHFVRDAYRTIFPHMLVHARQVVRRKHDLPSPKSQQEINALVITDLRSACTIAKR